MSFSSTSTILRPRWAARPTFNQTRALKPEHVAKAFGERAKLFRALRQRTDPLNRLRNSYFAYLLGSKAERLAMSLRPCPAGAPRGTTDTCRDRGKSR